MNVCQTNPTPALQEYEDLDEILARFIQPMASYARDIISHKCYRKSDGGNKDMLKKLLREEKAKNPKRHPYFFSASKELPGKFLLAYQPGSRPRYEYLTVTPDGIRYRSKLHTTLDLLLNWFKTHFHEPIPRPQPVNPSPALSMHSHIQTRITPMDPSSYGMSSRGPSSTPYTPTHLAYSTTPQYGQPTNSFAHPAAAGGGGGGYQQQYNRDQYRGSSGYPPQQQPRGAPNWNRGGSGDQGWNASQMVARTPMSTGGGRTPAYTPTQTPGSITSNMYEATPSMDGRHRRDLSPMGTPLLDE